MILVLAEKELSIHLRGLSRISLAFGRRGRFDDRIVAYFRVPGIGAVAFRWIGTAIHFGIICNQRTVPLQLVVALALAIRLIGSKLYLLLLLLRLSHGVGDFLFFLFIILSLRSTSAGPWRRVREPKLVCQRDRYSIL